MLALTADINKTLISAFTWLPKRMKSAQERTVEYIALFSNIAC